MIPSVKSGANEYHHASDVRIVVEGNRIILHLKNPDPGIGFYRINAIDLTAYIDQQIKAALAKQS